MDIKEKIITQLKTITGIQDPDVSFTSSEEFGDYTTNVAMVAAKQQGKKTRQLAEEYSAQIDKSLFDKVEVAGPGFINFYLKKDVLVDNLIQIDSKKTEYGKSDSLEGKRINFEFGQPNTHKLPHIGHLFSYVLGNSLTNILEAAGAKIYRVNYQGDIGPHVAKCLWAFEREKPDVPKDLVGKVKLLQKMYQTGSQAYEDSEEAKLEINQLNKLLYLKDTTVVKKYAETRQWSVDYYELFEERLGIKFDRYYFESEVEDKGREGVEKAVDTIFKKSEGAIIFEGSKYGLHDRVFITKYGTPTYEAKDTYLEVLKYKEWPYDLLIITTANEQNEYFKVIYKAIEQLHPNLKGKLKHIGFGMVNLTTGKMSSRTGKIVSAVDLIDLAKKEVESLVQKRVDIDETEKEKISEDVSMGAVKYTFLRSNPLQNIKFDIKESVSIEGNSGPYIQYTYARIQSVLGKAVKNKTILADKDIQINDEEMAIIRKLSQFTEIIVNAAKTYSPNLICNYLFHLASKFNTFYNKHKIVGGENEEFKLLLTRSTGQILQNGLKLLGIKTPNKM